VKRIQQALYLAIGFAVIGGALLVAIQQLVNTSNTAYIPTLRNRLWAGYYESAATGKIWCVAKFYGEMNSLKLVVLTFDQEPDVYSVQRHSTDGNFVELEFLNTRRPYMNMRAKQLYEGKRYLFGRLLVGRWSDFWKRNSDVRINGRLQNSPDKFLLEPVSPEEAVRFYRERVKHPVEVATFEELDHYLTSLER